MIGLLGRGSIAREQEKARPGRGRRATAVLGMLAVPLAAAGLTAMPAAAAPAYAVTATIDVGSYPVGGWRWTRPRTPSTWPTSGTTPCR